MRKIVTRDNCIGSFVDLIFGVFSILIFNYSFLLHKFIRLKRTSAYHQSVKSRSVIREDDREIAQSRHNRALLSEIVTRRTRVRFCGLNFRKIFTNWCQQISNITLYAFLNIYNFFLV